MGFSGGEGSAVTQKIVMEYFDYLLALAICGMACWKGDKPLRWSAAVFIGSWTLSPAISHVSRSGWDTPVAILDTNVALFLIWASLRWRRLWLAVFAALMILIVVVRVTAYLDRTHVALYAFQVSNNIVVQFQLVTLVIATGLSVRARRRADEDAG